MNDLMKDGKMSPHVGGPDSNTRYIRNSKTISGRLHDELVMMDLDQGKYFSLNSVATRIWELLERPMLPVELSTLLVEEYEIGMDQCREEVNAFLAEMVKLGIVKNILQE